MHITELPAKGAYVAAWRRINDLPDQAPVRTDWTGSRPAWLVRNEFAKALQARINERGGLSRANEPMDIGLVRDARRIEDIKVRRIRHYQFESDLCRRRFSHLLSNRND